MTDINWLNALKTTDLSKAMGMDTKQYHRWLKGQYKEYGTYALRDRLAHSMYDGTMWQRFRADEDGEGWRLYGFVLGEEFADWYDVETTNDLTDEEVDEWFEDHMAILFYSDYDCTGRAFTQWIDWHRNPDGAISYVHKVGLDV